MLPLKQEIKDYNHHRNAKTGQSSKYEEVLEKNRGIYKEQENELSILQEKLLALTENQQQIRQNILIWTEKGNSTALSIERGESDYKTNDQRLVVLRKDGDSFKQQSDRCLLHAAALDISLQ